MTAVDAPAGAPDLRVQPGAPVVAVSERYGGQRRSADAALDCLAALPDIQRRMLVMTYYDHLPGRAVADALSIDVPTVYSHLHEALTTMKCRLGG